MEGKALLFKYLGGVDAVPICLDVEKEDDFVRAVKWLQPSFGGVNLEDIAKPKCFSILSKLQESLEIPVWHDDQQGTAVVILAGLINAVKLVDKQLSEVRVSMVGAGAASTYTAHLIILAGVKPGNIVMCDSKGILHRERKNIRDEKKKWQIALSTNAQNRKGGIAEAMEGADVLIALSTPKPGTIRKEWVSRMENNSIVFACANPLPEIWPWEAKEGGARIVATGRSDFPNFPNQINNSLCFPGIFRGVLDVQSRCITDQMCIEAAWELARCAQEKGLDEENLLPTMEQWEIYPRQAAAVGSKAVEQKVARLQLQKEEIYKKSVSIILQVRKETQLLMERGFIPQPPE